MPDYLCLAIEAKTKCRKCDGALHINALTDSIICGSCAQEMILGISDWKSLIEDAMKDIPGFGEGEGANASIFAGNNYQITYGKQWPRFPESKKKLDVEKYSEFSEKGYALDAVTGKRHSFRNAPEKFRKAFPGMLFLAMEDWSLIPGGNDISNDATVNAPEPIAFACPKCGGYLDVDGKERMIKCSFCKASVYLPDDLWKRIHPVDTIKRWYIIIDKKAKPFVWENEIWDAVIDKKGDIFLASEDDNSNLTLACLDKNFITKWTAHKILPEPDSSEGNYRLSLSLDKKLLLWSREKHSLYFVSADTGQIEYKLGGNKGKQPQDAKEYFSMKNSWTLCADVNGTFLILNNREKQDENNFDCYELKRFDFEGNELEVWKEGLRLTTSKREPVVAEYLEEMKEKPVYFKDREIVMSVGYDGNYYFLNYEKLMKYSREGKKIYLTTLDFRFTYARPYADKEGNAYILGSSIDEEYSVMKISPDGSSVQRYLPSNQNKSALGQVEVMVMSEKGDFIFVGYGGKIRALGKDGKLYFTSEKSEEDDRKNI